MIGCIVRPCCAPPLHHVGARPTMGRSSNPQTFQPQMPETQEAAMNTQARIESPLLRSDDQGIATLTLHRPAARNALSEALIEALTREFDAIAADATVRAVVLTALGPVFSAGHDLKE